MVADSGGQSVAVLPDHGRKLVAVVYADMAGYSRLIGLDDAGTFERLRELRGDLIDPALVRHGGTLVSTGGDSLLARFDSIIPAMRCAVDVQRGVPDFEPEVAGHPVAFLIDPFDADVRIVVTPFGAAGDNMQELLDDAASNAGTKVGSFPIGLLSCD